jgi:hypothetical protein
MSTTQATREPLLQNSCRTASSAADTLVTSPRVELLSLSLNRKGERSVVTVAIGDLREHNASPWILPPLSMPYTPSGICFMGASIAAPTRCSS